jgi:hypothetical protein
MPDYPLDWLADIQETDIAWLFEHVSGEARAEFLEGASKRVFQISLHPQDTHLAGEYLGYLKSWLISTRLAESDDWQKRVGSHDDEPEPGSRVWTSDELADLLKVR